MAATGPDDVEVSPERRSEELEKVLHIHETEALIVKCEVTAMYDAGAWACGACVQSSLTEDSSCRAGAMPSYPRAGRERGVVGASQELYPDGRPDQKHSET
jgi:hypothetical protein